MAKFVHALFAGLICSSLTLHTQGASVRSSTSKVLAVTVSGINCAAGASRPSKLSTAAAAAQPGPTTATSCTLHACQAHSKDSTCQFQSMPQLSFAPCEQGAVLISTRYILQHLQAATAPAPAADSQDSQFADNIGDLSGPTDAGTATDSQLSDEFDPDSSSTPPTVSLLQLSAACVIAPAAAGQADGRSVAGRIGTPAWSDTFTLTLLPEDFTTDVDQLSSSSDLAAGSGSQHDQPFVELQPTAAPEALSAHLKDGWSAGNLEQLVLVDLLLHAAPEPPAEQEHASTAKQQPNSTAVDTTEQLLPDSADVMAGTCSAGWQLWLARACMVVFVGGLQLLPLSSVLLKARCHT